MKNGYFKYRLDENVDFNVDEKEFLTIVGNNNDLIVKTLLFTIKKGNVFVGEYELNDSNLDYIRKQMGFVLHNHLNIFLGETVFDEIAFGLESQIITKNEGVDLINNEIKRFKLEDVIDKDPNSLGSSDKVKMKILSSLIVKPKILVLYNIFSELDYLDKKLIIEILKEYKKCGGIIINFTNDIEESLYAERLIVINNKELLFDDKTAKVFENYKILNEIGVGIPFIIELNKMLLENEVIDKIIIDKKKLVGAIWK